MASPYKKRLDEPDEQIEFPNIQQDVVEIGELTVGWAVQHPGFRWSKDVRPSVGGEWCQAHHIGVVISGRFRAILQDGTELEFGPRDVYDIPPGHDGMTVGDEPCVAVEWSGLRTFAGLHAGHRGRILTTLMFTDIVDSTVTAKRLGDTAWGELLSRHYAAIRTHLDRFSGREVKTTGDGFLAMFEGPANALRCAAAIRQSAAAQGIQVRGGVHVGEVESVGSDVRGIAVHEAARVLASAQPDEILVSEVAKSLVAAGGMSFEDRGLHELKGIEGQRRLFAFVS